MQYMGGKSRISSSIAEIINAVSGRKIKNSETHIRNIKRIGGGTIVCKFVLR